VDAKDLLRLEGIEQVAASERGRRWTHLVVTVVTALTSIDRISRGELTKGGWTTASLLLLIFGAFIFARTTLRAWGKDQELELLLKLSAELKHRRSEIGTTDSRPATAEPQSVF
jgi:hypothetical protein